MPIKGNIIFLKKYFYIYCIINNLIKPPIDFYLFYKITYTFTLICAFSFAYL